MKLKWKITLPVLALLLLSTLVTTVINYTMTKASVDQIVDNIIESNLETLVSLVDRAEVTERVVSDEMDNKNLALTRAFAEIVRLNAQGGMLDPEDAVYFQRVADMLDVDEVHIMDHSGILIGGNVELYYGFDFGSGDQTIPFLRILDDPTYELAQEPQPNASYGYLLQYAGVARTDEKGLVQVGIGADMIEMLHNLLSVSNTVADMRVGMTGHAALIEDGIVVYSEHSSLIGRDVSGVDWFRQVSSGRGTHWMDMDTESVYAGYANVGSTTLLVLFPRAEYNDYLSPVVNAAIIGIIVALLIPTIVFILVNRLLKPLIPVTDFMQRSSSMGDFTLQPDVLRDMTRTGRFNDEIDELSVDAVAFVRRITEVSQKLESIADGDLTEDISTLSDRDTLGHSLNKMAHKLNDMFAEIHDSAEQVSRGSRQIADGSQVLAKGSTEQAASIEELSGSITEIAKNTRENADIAGKTSDLADTIRGNAEKGAQQMADMMSAVRDINQASQSISKVIKVIDDIAFQTNILALNAAVEAARAGQHGKGFAVVAEEVRNLASKSAEAAKDTGALIQDSVAKAELGSRIAGDTSASLEEIVSGINESARYIAEIAKSSEEQSHGIEQLNVGIDHVAQVIRQNNATAEQSAAASEEMSAQSALLQQLIAQFKLKGQGVQTLPARLYGGY